MKIFLIFLSCCSLGFSVSKFSSSSSQEDQIVHLPEVKDAYGSMIDWSLYDQKSLILFFHKPGLNYSERGLTRLLSQLQRDKATHGPVALFVIVFQQEKIAGVVEEVEDARIEAEVLLDNKHQAFRELSVIAFPTAFVADRRRHVVHTSKGYGPQQSVQLALAARYGAGLLSDADYQSLQNGDLPTNFGNHNTKLRRHVHLARGMAAQGQLEDALLDLQRALSRVPAEARLDVEAMELLTRLYLRLGRQREAETALADLEKAFPQTSVLPLLHCRLALLEEDWTLAKQSIQGISPALLPEVWLLRGRILEAQENFQDAALLYRTQLEAMLLSSGG